jgi:DNA invertase Pin-like site-specific DNA recombinase
VDCLNHIRTLEENSIRFIAVIQGLDTDLQNPALRFLLHVLGAAAEFERALIRERTQAGQARYRQDFELSQLRPPPEKTDSNAVCYLGGHRLYFSVCSVIYQTLWNEW